jgi:hypothetical protein
VVHMTVILWSVLAFGVAFGAAFGAMHLRH